MYAILVLALSLQPATASAPVADALIDHESCIAEAATHLATQAISVDRVVRESLSACENEEYAYRDAIVAADPRAGRMRASALARARRARARRAAEEITASVRRMMRREGRRLTPRS